MSKGNCNKSQRECESLYLFEPAIIYGYVSVAGSVNTSVHIPICGHVGCTVCVRIPVCVWGDGVSIDLTNYFCVLPHIRQDILPLNYYRLACVFGETEWLLVWPRLNIELFIKTTYHMKHLNGGKLVWMTFEMILVPLLFHRDIWMCNGSDTVHPRSLPLGP